MKQFRFVLSIVALLVFFSCSEEVDNIETDVVTQQEPTQEEIDALIAKNQADFEAHLLSDFGTIDYETFNATMNRKEMIFETVAANSMLKSAPVVYGPFTGTMNAVKILSNYQMYVGSQPGLAAGIYLCDVYRYLKEATLPSDAITGWANSVTPEGFSNYSTQTPGFAESQASGSNVLNIFTYKIHVRYNMALQSINKVYPSHLNNVTSVSYSYSYLK